MIEYSITSMIYDCNIVFSGDECPAKTVGSRDVRSSPQMFNASGEGTCLLGDLMTGWPTEEAINESFKQPPHAHKENRRRRRGIDGSGACSRKRGKDIGSNNQISAF